MAIVISCDRSDFVNAFERYNRMDNFSREGLEVLFDYLEDYSDSTGEPIELDVIALCCEYEESSIQEIIDNYAVEGTEPEEGEEAFTDEEIRQIVHDFLLANTSVCGETSDGFVYACF